MLINIKSVWKDVKDGESFATVHIPTVGSLRNHDGDAEDKDD